MEAKQVSDEPQQLKREAESSTPEYDLDSEAIIKCAIVKTSLILFHAEREKTEQGTREQSNNHEWFKARSKRITGSKCGKILCKKKISVSLLSGCLYPKPLVPLPKSIAWGRHYESIAIEKYTFHMKALGKNVVVSKSGFIVHPEKVWLGASPDGFVKDTTYEFPDGLRSSVPTQNKKRPQKKLALTQIFIANWKTPKGVSVERIFPDKKWQNSAITIISDDFMLPEIVLGKYKPSYYL